MLEQIHEKIQEYIVLITQKDHFLPLYDKTNKKILIDEVRKNFQPPLNLPIESTKTNHLYRIVYITKQGIQEIKVEESAISDYIIITGDPKWNEILNRWKENTQVVTLLQNLPQKIITLREEQLNKLI